MGISGEPTEQRVLAVLAGAPLADVATQAAIEPSALASAVDLYRAAGRAALQQQATRRGWRQLWITFPDQSTAEHTVATHLGPRLHEAEAAGTISSWWFIRKHQWRLRLHPGRARPPGAMRTFLDHALDELRARQLITAWWETIYEPETHAFGGTQAMAVAHDLFHRDSRCILDHLARPTPTTGRREVSILLCNLLMAGATQDWYERGDIWARVVAHRPDDPGTSPEQLRRLKPQLRRLMTVDLGPSSGPVRRGRLRFASRWVEAFEQTGKALGELASDGRLCRGLRAVLAHHILFHWNRLGITPASQATLARAARDVILDT